MDDLLAEFLTETSESLETIDNELVRFEADPTDRATLNNVFRLVHTIKGTCGFLGLPRLQAVAHAGETLLGRFRDGAVVATPDAVQLVLECIDAIKAILAFLETDGAEPVGDDMALILQLEAASEGHLTAEKAPPLPVVEVSAEPEMPAVNAEGLKWDPEQGRYLRPGEVSMAEMEAAFQATEVDEVIIVAKAASAPAPKAMAAATKTDDHDEDGAPRGGGVAAQTIRVGVDVLENLMTMVSELVLTRNQLNQMVRNSNDSEFKAPLQRLSAITAELQEGVMKTRMQPIGNAWKKLPRIVRDAARDLNKKIDLVLEGESVELDRQVLELIKDPLTHMIRNSCDHGLEKTADRLMIGKPEIGTIRLKAYHEGGHIIIELSDDGAGLNTARIRDKAISQGIVSAEAAATLSDAQIHRFIFAPGFSTAAQVTSLSGRGVGMDVVRTNIELIGGAIDLNSNEGRGTSFAIKIPLTLAIVSALVVGASEMRFAIPQLAVIELVRAGGTSEHRIEMLNKTRVLRLRDRLLPLVHLSELLGGADHKHTENTPTSFVVVMQVGGRSIGVIVDEVFDTEEIVVKPLSSVMRDVRMFSGATILGDGSVIMIIDPTTLANSIANAVNGKAEEAQTHQQVIKDERTGMILFLAGSSEPKAVPLALVTRLEDIDAGTFERADGRCVVQYRGRLMPIVPVSPYAEIKSQGRQHIMVFTQGDHTVGLAVDSILDIVDEKLDMEMPTDDQGTLGVAVLKGKATEILDIGSVMERAYPSWDQPAGAVVPRRVLLVEGNAFFRNLLAPLITSAGYQVDVADSAQAAANHIGATRFDALVTDIDAFSAESLGTEAPVIGLAASSNAAAPGVIACVRKGDRPGLIAALEHAMRMGEAA